jgi:hypothetical protein
MKAPLDLNSVTTNSQNNEIMLDRNSSFYKNEFKNPRTKGCEYRPDHALLSSIAADPQSGLPRGAMSTEADQAMAALCRAVAAGYRDEPRLRAEPDLAVLREREHFRLLLLDLAFPDPPFAQTR